MATASTSLHDFEITIGTTLSLTLAIQAALSKNQGFPKVLSSLNNSTELTASLCHYRNNAMEPESSAINVADFKLRSS